MNEILIICTANMKRRNFIYLGAAGAVSLVVPGCRPSDHILRKKIALPAMLAGFSDEKGLKKIGKEYDARLGGKSSYYYEDALLEEAKHANVQVNNIVPFLAEQAQRDFESEKMVVADGWVISETEARQCALLALI